MVLRIRITTTAYRSLEESCAYLASDESNQLARCFQDAVWKRLAYLTENPEAGIPLRALSSQLANVRYLYLPQFHRDLVFYLPQRPYLIFLLVRNSDRDLPNLKNKILTF